MRSYQSRVLPWVAITLLLQSHTWGQRREVFRARLTAVPVDTVTARTTTGLGSLTATLEGGTLTFHGTFDSMNSRATAAHVHRAPKGLRGPNIFELTITKAVSGNITGTVKLSAAQIADLEREWYYVQIHTELNTAGQLRGWLLKTGE